VTDSGETRDLVALIAPNSDPDATQAANEGLAMALDALAKASSGDAQKRVYRHLLDGPLLVAIAAPPTEPASSDGGPRVNLLTVPTAGGAQAVLAFSHAGAFRSWGLSDAFAVAPGNEIIALLVAKGLSALSLNAAGPVAVTLEAWELAALAYGRLPTADDERRWAADTAEAAEVADVTAQRVVSAPLAPVDEGFLHPLREALADHNDVIMAYLFESDRIGLHRQLVVALDLPRDRFEPVAHALWTRLAPLAAPYAVLRFTRAEHDDTLRELAATAPAVYRRP